MTPPSSNNVTADNRFAARCGCSRLVAVGIRRRVGPDPFVSGAFWNVAVTGFRDLDPLASLSTGLVSGVSGLLGGRSVTRRFSSLLLLWITEIGAVGKRQ